MSIRTDLALEAHEMYTQNTPDTSAIDGAGIDITEEEGIKTTRITITNQNASDILKKPIGTYITIEAPDLKYDTDIYENVCMIIADEINSLFPVSPETKTLVAGLGNRGITPDALGPAVTERLIVTNHMSDEMKTTLGKRFSSVSAIAPGVLGTTGIETADIIKGICDKLKPDLIIAVDALAARSLDRVSTTIQISDTGITPGAGIGNRRDTIDPSILGAKIISVGVATVVDAGTIAYDSIDKTLRSVGQSRNDSEKNELIKKELSKDIASLMVTPKDIDSVIEKASKTIANGINLALHKNLTFEEIESFTG